MTLVDAAIHRPATTAQIGVLIDLKLERKTASVTRTQDLSASRMREETIRIRAYEILLNRVVMTVPKRTTGFKRRWSALTPKSQSVLRETLDFQFAAVRYSRESKGLAHSACGDLEPKVSWR
jgi:hypothetical protein